MVGLFLQSNLMSSHCSRTYAKPRQLGSIWLETHSQLRFLSLCLCCIATFRLESFSLKFCEYNGGMHRESYNLMDILLQIGKLCKKKKGKGKYSVIVFSCQELWFTPAPIFLMKILFMVAYWTLYNPLPRAQSRQRQAMRWRGNLHRGMPWSPY